MKNLIILKNLNFKLKQSIKNTYLIVFRVFYVLVDELIRLLIFLIILITVLAPETPEFIALEFVALEDTRVVELDNLVQACHSPRLLDLDYYSPDEINVANLDVIETKTIQPKSQLSYSGIIGVVDSAPVESLPVQLDSVTQEEIARLEEQYVGCIRDILLGFPRETDGWTPAARADHALSLARETVQLIRRD